MKRDGREQRGDQYEPQRVQEHRREPDNRPYGEGAALVTDVAKHEAAIVRSARRERCEAGDPGTGEKAHQEVGAFVQNHTRKHQEIEGHTPKDTTATETRDAHQAAHHVRTGSV